MVTHTVLAVFCLVTLGEGFLLGNRHICYEDLGCFNNSHPFNNALDTLPDSPTNIDVTFRLYTRDRATDGEVIRYNDVDSIRNSGYDAERTTKFIIHGYMSMASSDWVINITHGFLKKEDCNVITVDWQKGATTVYQQAVANTRIVGAIGAKLVQSLKDNLGTKMENIHLTGHSLGAQTCGYIGRRVPNIGRISAFDPAGPLFEHYDTRVRLDPTDALFVDVIHSDAVPFQDAGFGTVRPSGHIDFYPNGGGHQPGCPPAVKKTLEEMLTLQFTQAFEAVACSHQRSYWYFLESLVNDACQFHAHACTSYDDYKKGKCSGCGNGPCPIMGYYANKSNRTGSFYLTTNSQSPFCISS